MPKKPKPDKGHSFADSEIGRMEKELKKEYDKAYNQLKKKADKYFEGFKKREAAWLEKIKNGEATEKEYLAWREQELLHNKRFDVLVKSLSQEMTKTNQMARDIVNGHLADIYAENYNYAAWEICKETGINLRFDLADKRTVEVLQKGKVNVSKDLRYNNQKVRSALLQGVVQGDSVDKIATRLRRVSDMSKEASVRNARTMTTSAENAGRQDRFEEAAEEYGIEMQKTWIATLDDRTRDAHAELDGVTVDIDQDFRNSLGKIAYPGDPDADGANVYNCRCTMVSSIKGHPKNLSQREMSDKLGGMSYEQWKKEASERAEEAARKKNGR